MSIQNPQKLYTTQSYVLSSSRLYMLPAQQFANSKAFFDCCQQKQQKNTIKCLQIWLNYIMILWKWEHSSKYLHIHMSLSHNKPFSNYSWKFWWKKFHIILKSTFLPSLPLPVLPIGCWQRRSNLQLQQQSKLPAKSHVYFRLLQLTRD